MGVYWKDFLWGVFRSTLPYLPLLILLIILQCIHMDWKYIIWLAIIGGASRPPMAMLTSRSYWFGLANVRVGNHVWLVLIGGKSPHGDARKRSYRFGWGNVRVGNHIYRKQMVVPTMCKFVLFGSFYSKIWLDTCITAVKETKKNIYIHILVSTTLASLFTIKGLCPVNFIHTHKRNPCLACLW